MGHSIQVVSVLVGAADAHLAVPLAGRIHEGLKFTNRDHRTLPGKCCDLLDSLGLEEPFYFVADAFYGCQTVAYLPAPPPAGRRKRGRPRLYGKRIKLWTLFDSDQETWQSAESPVDIETRLTSMVRGSIKHGDYNPLQMGSFRPNASCVAGRSPIEGLYLCGSSSYPGGLVIGGPGYIAAGSVVEDLAAERWWRTPRFMARYQEQYLS